MNGILQTGPTPAGQTNTARSPLPAAAASPAGPGAMLRHAIEQQVVPQLLSRHGVVPAAGTLGAGTPELFTRLSVELAMDAVGPNPERVGARLDRLLEGGADPEELCLHVLAPAARHLGQLWVEDRLDFVDVTLGTMRLERALRGLLLAAPVRRAVGRAPTILMMPLPGNQHTFGLTMAADFFRRAGWIVSDGSVCGSPGASPDGLDGLEKHLRVTVLDAVGLAISCETQMDGLSRALRMIRSASRNPRIRIALGGPLFLVQPGMSSRFDADLVVTDAAKAPLQLAALLPDSDTRPESRRAPSAPGRTT